MTKAGVHAAVAILNEGFNFITQEYRTCFPFGVL